MACWCGGSCRCHGSIFLAVLFGICRGFGLWPAAVFGVDCAGRAGCVRGPQISRPTNSWFVISLSSVASGARNLGLWISGSSEVVASGEAGARGLGPWMSGGSELVVSVACGARGLGLWVSKGCELVVSG